MASNEKDQKLLEGKIADVEVGTEADLDEVMKKYDRESNTRVWEGIPKLAVKVIAVAFSLYCMYVTLWSQAAQHVRLYNFLAMIVVLGYLTYPIKKGHVKVNSLPWYDIIFMLAGVLPLLYCSYVYDSVIVTQARRLTRNPLMCILAVLVFLSLVELCRRCVGLPILCVVGALVLYTFLPFGAGIKYDKAIYDLFYTLNGLLGAPINVCAKYIVLFIIFGAFLERTGISNFFIDLANSIAGSASGGPAKVAVLSSALCGMVSGSSVGNTVTTGSITIPMMKKTGYKPEFAGAVEAAASTGGQIMPPIMGAAAFLMAEYVGEPFNYGKIALLAILPAVLYFTGIFIAVHLEAKKLGLKGIPRNQLPKMKDLMPKIYLLLPLVVLVWLVSSGKRTMQSSAAIAILVTIVVGLMTNVINAVTKKPDKSDNITVGKFFDALEAGGKGTISVAAACAMAGIVAGCITTTGLASKLITAIVRVSGGQAIIALFLTMICCIVLGMGVPTTANYCIMASTCAPILVNPAIGIPMICAHFFVFYFGIVADITPPVALAAYAGSAIAKAPPMKTAFNATRLAIAAFIVPYIFALNPSMLFQFPEGTSSVMMVVLVVQICITALLGLFGVAASLNGFLYRPINPLFRILMALGGLAMLIPGTLTDVVGLVTVGAVVVLQRMGAKKTT